MPIKTHTCIGHPRRAQTGPIRWNGRGYARMMYAHGALATMQAARARRDAR
ncbi:hypothetical protein SEA_ROBSFEET_78 [Microbacterium phage RobsFeet]|uniref:Uncharacterized protein n=1 Tax=Microbacterium phage RobsFeet TaxID=2201442 RepID=A0A2Z4Q7X0_9CAUD|nr:hypothetical protein HOT43_gp80 [Microbacterium phage RobsFeet]AWY06084.1 hypothetical protein SEA_ROBSFEET_78 [Microbacterium phage RobsFeet]